MVYVQWLSLLYIETLHIQRGFSSSRVVGAPYVTLVLSDDTTATCYMPGRLLCMVRRCIIVRHGTSWRPSWRTSLLSCRVCTDLTGVNVKQRLQSLRDKPSLRIVETRRGFHQSHEGQRTKVTVTWTKFLARAVSWYERRYLNVIQFCRWFVISRYCSFMYLSHIYFWQTPRVTSTNVAPFI